MQETKRPHKTHGVPQKVGSPLSAVVEHLEELRLEAEERHLRDALKIRNASGKSIQVQRKPEAHRCDDGYPARKSCRSKPETMLNPSYLAANGLAVPMVVRLLTPPRAAADLHLKSLALSVFTSLPFADRSLQGINASNCHGLFKERAASRSERRQANNKEIK